ncbi:hypothetical protein GCM10007940_00870 [Portibacter lacus]|uniref:Uncharacterized protein n=1 Tax=Portibacter lacus TaxID=1099794 RepID=A0AA37SLI7_9BACT|nr:hypothetical protein GCM10007940_00870 [Portibacter lacus]
MDNTSERLSFIISSILSAFSLFSKEYEALDFSTCLQLSSATESMNKYEKDLSEIIMLIEEVKK